MKKYSDIAQKLSRAEDELDAALVELRRLRIACRDNGYQDRDLCARGERAYFAAKSLRDQVQSLLDQMETMHRRHWSAALELEMDAARTALQPLLRAWRIRRFAFGSPGGPIDDVATRMLREVESVISQEPVGDVPLAPPRSRVLEDADEDLAL